MAIILLRLLAALFVYHHAKKRGHGAMAAILWSVGSGVVPLILPVYFILGRKSKQQKNYNDHDIIDIEATVVEEQISCSKCGSLVKEDFLVCPYCQEPLGKSKQDN